MRVFLCLIFLLLPIQAFSADWSWDKADYIREGVSAGITVIDWGQTRDIHNHQGVIEMNAILGPHPSNRAIDNYFHLVIPIHALISVALPKEVDSEWFGKLYPRIAWQYMYLGIEGVAVTSNAFRYGLKMSF